MWAFLKKRFSAQGPEPELPPAQGEERPGGWKFQELLAVATTAEVISVLTSIFTGSHAAYALFTHGTVIVFETRVANLEAEARGIIQEHGPNLPGSSFGDFGVHELTLNRGFLVSSHHPSLFTYVSPKQMPGPTTPTMATGLYGREMRQMDYQQQEIIHVAKLGREPAN